MDEQEGNDGRKVTRRDFVAACATGACAGGIGLALVGTLRSAVPSVLPDPSQTFRIGTLADYPEGSSKNFPEEKVMVFRDAGGLFAISTICTHLGCVVGKTPDGFKCPCHGSVFSPRGKVLRGPAPRSLEWLEVRVASSGHLILDRSRKVPLGTKLQPGSRVG